LTLFGLTSTLFLSSHFSVSHRNHPTVDQVCTQTPLNCLYPVALHIKFLAAELFPFVTPVELLMRCFPGRFSLQDRGVSVRVAFPTCSSNPAFLLPPLTHSFGLTTLRLFSAFPSLLRKGVGGGGGGSEGLPPSPNVPIVPQW